ncbi:hypothetical protein BB560_000085 [Smittium megazygosporum]|uniref:Helicase ATP-binding domain-containing protein n=1 Tax=Smittium megazygosporum TaxID=133381 RepID=A0A2T9ZLB3_9FUNG|nr:hypothetical protein BB560_000085 [Smittium megazygosporum]
MEKSANESIKTKYTKLFQGFVTIYSLLANRLNAAPTFEQLAPSVQKISSESFSVLDVCFFKEILFEFIHFEVKFIHESENTHFLETLAQPNPETANKLTLGLSDTLAGLFLKNVSLFIRLIEDKSLACDSSTNNNMASNNSKDQHSIPLLRGTESKSHLKKLKTDNRTPKKRKKEKMPQIKKQVFFELGFAKSLIKIFSDRLNTWMETDPSNGAFCEEYLIQLAKKYIGECFVQKDLQVHNTGNQESGVDQNILETISKQGFFCGQFNLPSEDVMSSSSVICVPGCSAEYSDLLETQKYNSSNSKIDLDSCIFDQDINISKELLEWMVLYRMKSCFSIKNFYSHQEFAFKYISRDENIMVTTGTSSGKSAIFQYAILKSLFEFLARTFNKRYDSIDQVDGNPGTGSGRVRGQTNGSSPAFEEHFTANSANFAREISDSYFPGRTKSNDFSLNFPTALIIFPFKALAHNQLSFLKSLFYFIPEFSSYNLSVEILDGDTSKRERDRISSCVNVLLTNPDCLHCSILPNHLKWARFLRNLNVVVIDEVHVYTGAFLKHFEMILARMQRLIDLYGTNRLDSQPGDVDRLNKIQFVLCSATVSGPQKLASHLLPRAKKFSFVTESGAPRPDINIVLWTSFNRKVDEIEDLTKFNQETNRETKSIKSKNNFNGINSIKKNRTFQSMSGMLLQDAKESEIEDNETEKGERSDIEERKKWDRITLEKISRFFEKFSLEKQDTEIDKMDKGQTFFKSSEEHEDIVIGHLQCAAFELPIDGLYIKEDGEKLAEYGRYGIDENKYFDFEKVGHLVKKYLEFEEIRGVFVPKLVYKPWPSIHVKVRNIECADWPLVCVQGKNRSIEQGSGLNTYKVLEYVDTERASYTFHKGAVVVFVGRTYVVEDIDFKEKIIIVEERHGIEYYTVPEMFTTVRVIFDSSGEYLGVMERYKDGSAARPAGNISQWTGNRAYIGPATLRRRIVSYKKEFFERKMRKRDSNGGSTRKETISVEGCVYEYQVISGLVYAHIGEQITQRIKGRAVFNVVGNESSLKAEEEGSSLGWKHIISHMVVETAAKIVGTGGWEVIRLDCSEYTKPRNLSDEMRNDQIELLLHTAEGNKPLLREFVQKLYSSLNEIMDRVYMEIPELGTENDEERKTALRKVYFDRCSAK